MEGDEEARYHQKLMLKADIIIGAANRLWGTGRRPSTVMNAVVGC